MRVADPKTLTEKLPPALIADWLKYFEYKDNRFDKLEYYLVQLSALIGSITGADTSKLVWRRPGDGEAGGAEKTKITAAEAEKALRAAFGV